MASSSPVCIEEAFADSPVPDIVNESQPLPTLPVPPAASITLEPAPSLTNGCISSPGQLTFTTPAKLSTLKKSSSKKKQSRLSKERDSIHSQTGTYHSPDHSDRGNGECPYADLDSVPKILCPKALERQQKLVSGQPSFSVIKEVKKQPEVHSGLWFSKSGKERRPKTISPMPDRNLFSKVACKKKNSSTCTKKTIGSGASFVTAATDQVELQDKHKDGTVLLPLEQSGQSKCKSVSSASRTFVASGSPTEQSTAPLDKQDLSVCVNTRVTSDKWDFLQCRLSDTADIETGSTGLGQSSHIDSKNSPETSFKDQTSFAEIVEHVRHAEESNVTNNEKSSAKERESSNTPVANLNLNTTALEMAKGLVSQCRLPYVKLIRKDLKGRVSNSGVTIVQNELAECTQSEKINDNCDAKLTPEPLEFTENNAAGSMDKVDVPESKKVLVKKLKASGEIGILRLSSEQAQEDVIVPPQEEATLPLQEEVFLAPNVDRVSVELLNSSSEESCVNKTLDLSSSASDQRERERVSTGAPSSCSSDLRPANAAAALQPWSSNCGDFETSKDSTSDKPLKVAHTPKPVPEKVKKHTLPEQPAHLSASSRLMTRALKAMQEAKQKKLRKAQSNNKKKKSLNISVVSTRKPEAKQKNSTKAVKSFTSPRTTSYHQEALSSCPSTSSLSDSSDFEVKSEDEDLSVSSTPPMDFIPLTSKVKEKSDCCISDPPAPLSPPSPFSFMNSFKNVKEVSFQSLTNQGKGKPLSFKAEPNYKFSTFLMMLKDLHDTRDREGTPLELEIGPPGAHVKEEPSMLPGGAAAAADDQEVEQINQTSSPVNLCNIVQNGDRTFQASRKSPGRRSSSTGARRKANHKVPSRPGRSGPGYPGLFSLPTEDPSSEPGIQPPIGIQTGNWQNQEEGGSGGSEEQEESWSRLMVDRHEKKLSYAAPWVDLANGPTGTCAKERRRAMQNAEGGSKTNAGEK